MPAAVRPPEEWAAVADLVADLDYLDRKGTCLADPDARLGATFQKSDSCFPSKENGGSCRHFHSLPAAFSRVAVLPSPLAVSLESASFIPAVA